MLESTRSKSSTWPYSYSAGSRKIKEVGGEGVTSQPGVSRAGTLDFGGIEFQSPVVSIQRGVIALESWWCAERRELLFALFLLSWMSKGVRGKAEVTS